MKKVLVVVDYQNDFVSGALGTPEAAAIRPVVAEKIRLARQAGAAVVFTRDTHSEGYLDTQEGKNLPVTHCIKSTAGWEVVDGLAAPGDSFVDKPTFGSLALGGAVQKAAGGVPCEVELIGVCTGICVISNALILKAALPETRVVVDAACCACVTPESHKTALAAMKGCQVSVINE